MTRVTRDELETRCRTAILAAGASEYEAEVLASATAEAEFVGNPAVGVGHLPDYLDGYRAGRITADAQVTVERPRPGVVSVDAGGGIAQTAFDRALSYFANAIRASGVAALWIRGSFTCGELGYYPRRLAAGGFLALAMANSPALMSLGGSPGPVLGTNPLAYAVPRPGMLPLLIDQASSSIAFVNVRRAAEAGEPIPQGWAVDAKGEPTVDAAAALGGALLPFGSHRGGNVALLVELLATLSGGEFSLDAPPFDQGSQTPGIGVFVLGVDSTIFPGSVERATRHLATVAEHHGVTLPAMSLTEAPKTVEVNDGVLAALGVGL